MLARDRFYLEEGAGQGPFRMVVLARALRAHLAAVQPERLRLAGSRLLGTALRAVYVVGVHALHVLVEMRVTPERKRWLSLVRATITLLLAPAIDLYQALMLLVVVPGLLWTVRCALLCLLYLQILRRQRPH